MKLLLATSPHINHPKLIANGFKQSQGVMHTFSPVGLLSLVSVANQLEFIDAVEIFYLNKQINLGNIAFGEEFYGQVADLMCAKKPNVIGFMTECDSYHHVLNICKLIKLQLPDCHIILGGPHASATSRETMKRCGFIDGVVKGEGEIGFSNFLSSLNSSILDPIPGVIFRAKSGAIIDGGDPKLVDDLDLLPVPAYEHYQAHPGEEIFIEVGRGCPFNCSFCSTAPFWKRRHRTKSPERIVDEITLVQELFDTERVHFTHDLFTTNKNWVISVCKKIVERKVKVKWTCSARVDTVDDELLETMSSAGCDGIYFGLESGSKRILNSIGKNIPLEESYDVISKCVSLGLTPNVGFIVGFPDEDAQSIVDTFNAYETALILGCKPAHIFTFCPFNDSPIYTKLKKYKFQETLVDLPLGKETELKNIEFLGNNRELFGSFFKIDSNDVIPDYRKFLTVLDEFSPLVEAVQAPALYLAGELGGVYDLLLKWTTWIERVNTLEKKPLKRLLYGTPLDFARFIDQTLNEILRHLEEKDYILQSSNFHLLETHAQSEVNRTLQGSSISKYRSFLNGSEVAEEKLPLDTRLSCNNIIAKMKSDFSVPSLLTYLGGERPKEDTTYLVWHRTSTDMVKLLQVGQSIYNLVQTLADRPKTIREILYNQLNDPNTSVPIISSDIFNSALRYGLVFKE